MDLWTGLACLVPDPACKNFRRFGDGKGAYVNVVAWAESAKHSERRVTASAKEQLDFIVREMEGWSYWNRLYNARDARTSCSPCERQQKDSRMMWCSGVFMFGHKTIWI